MTIEAQRSALIGHVLERLCVLGPTFETFGRQHADNGVQWIVGSFVFHYHHASERHDWTVNIAHDDGDTLQIIRDTRVNRANDNNICDLHGPWDDALQTALQTIENACEDEEKRCDQKRKTKEYEQNTAKAKKLLKFAAMFPGGDE